MEKKQPKVEVSCNYCQTKFMKKRNRLKVYPISYCSLKCKGLDTSKNKIKQLNCFFCKENYSLPLSAVSASSQFCSQACYGESKKNGFIIECNNCDNKFYKNQWALSQKELHFCSKNCYHVFYKKTTNQERINKNSNVLNQLIKPYPKYYSISYRNKAIKFYGLKCQNSSCLINKNNIDLKASQFDVDHIDGNRNNNNMSNLQVLCCLCHSYKTRILKNET